MRSDDGVEPVAPATRPAARVLRAIHAIETGVLVLLVLALVGLAGTQILARLFFDGGWYWVDPLSRALVLWTGMLGALAAARGDRHISLDALTRVLRGNALRAAGFLTFGFAAAISALLAWYGWRLVELDRESATLAFGPVFSWQVELILPVGFGLLALRFAIRALRRPLPVAPP
jgi:TRAP-type C4-dicarboxylate transport system permease small subunit